MCHQQQNPLRGQIHFHTLLGGIVSRDPTKPVALLMTRCATVVAAKWHGAGQQARRGLRGVAELTWR